MREKLNIKDLNFIAVQLKLKEGELQGFSGSDLKQKKEPIDL